MQRGLGGDGLPDTLQIAQEIRLISQGGPHPPNVVHQSRVTVEALDTVIRYVDPRCSGCETFLEPSDAANADSVGWRDLLPARGLTIRVHGFYGGAYDMTGEALAPLCAMCVEDLFRQFPKIKALLELQSV